MIRKAKLSEIKEVKKLIDSFEEMDVIPETFPEIYYQRILKKGILLVSVEENKIVGVCFGTYNIKEGWADMLGLVVTRDFQKKGIGTSLISSFEKFARDKKLKTIDLDTNEHQLQFFKKLGYQQGKTLVAFRKKL